MASRCSAAAERRVCTRVCERVRGNVDNAKDRDIALCPEQRHTERGRESRPVTHSRIVPRGGASSAWPVDAITRRQHSYTLLRQLHAFLAESVLPGGEEEEEEV